MEEKRGQHIRWKEPEASSFPANGFHSKVNRTYSVGLGGHPPAASPLTHPSINRRSSPDGSAAADAEQPGHLSTTAGHKQIDDERAFLTTAAGLRYDDDVDAKEKDVGRRSHAPQAVTAAGDGPSTAEVTQPYLGQNGDDACAPSRDMEPSALDVDVSDAMYSPVASESRGELLQCEGGTVALEDVLRHYWLLSDRDDELPKRRDNRSASVSDDDTPFDWNSKRSEVSCSYRGQPGLSDWIARSPEIMLPLDCDEDADSVVTLSTISEEDEDDLSSVSEADSMTGSLNDSATRISENGEKSFGDNSGDVVRDDVERDATDFYDVDFLSEKSEDFDDQSDLSAEMEKVILISEDRGLITRHPDGVEDDRLPSSSSMMDSFVRSFSDYVSDIYPFSPAFVSHESNVFVGGEGSSCHTESNPSLDPSSVDGFREYTVTDTLLHIKLVSSLDETDFSRRRDQATNTLADQNSELVWSGNDVRSSITSPTSWYTVSDIFNSLSFETASEMADEDSSGEAAVSTANARCTAVARCLVGHLSKPSDLLPSSTVSVKVTAADPFAAIGRAAARAASQATSRAVRDFPTSEKDAEVVEIVVTTTCVLNRINNLGLTDSSSESDAMFILKNDAAVETQRCSVDVATQISIHNKSFDYNDGCTTEETCGIRFQGTSGKHFRNTPAIPSAYFVGGTEEDVVDEWSSAVDEATQGSCTCSVAVPCTGSDGEVRPQFDEATCLPTATGVVTTADFEVTSVAIKEPARERKVLLPKETIRNKDKERGPDVVPFGLYTTLEKENNLGNRQGIDKKREEHFRNSLKHSGILEKPGDSTAVTECKDSLQTRNIEKLPETNREESHPVDLNPVPEKSSERGEPAIETCDGIPKSGIVGANPERQSLGKNPITVDTSSKSQQLCTVYDKLESQNVDANKAITANDKEIHSEGRTVLQDSETKNGSNVLRRTCHSPSPQQLVSDEKNSKRNKFFRVQKSQSLLLETDIDTLEHRRTPVPRKGSRGAASETKSCTDLSSSKVSQYKPLRSPFSFGRGRDTPFSKEALAEMLSDSGSSAGAFVKKKPDWGSSPEAVGHCLSEPSLQLSPGKESTTSRNSTGNRNTGTGHLLERFSSGTRWRMYRSQETVSTKKQITSSPVRTDTAKVIECYEQSPSLRRRSLHIIETSLQRRAAETATVQRTQSSMTPPSQRLSSDGTGVKRHSSSPASSSFENLVDSLLGITAVMSMGAAVSHTRSSHVVIPSEQLEPLGGGGNSPKNLLRTFSKTSPTSATRSDEKKTRFEMGNEARPVDQATVPLVEISGSSPVHANPAVRKHVHFRKAKHIFRKCHFCIDANESRSGNSTSSKSPSHEATRKKTNGKKRH